MGLDDAFLQYDRSEESSVIRGFTAEKLSQLMGGNGGGGLQGELYELPENPLIV